MAAKGIRTGRNYFAKRAPFVGGMVGGIYGHLYDELKGDVLYPEVSKGERKKIEEIIGGVAKKGGVLPSAITIEKELEARRRLEKKAEEMIREQRPIERALKDVESGRIGKALQLLQNKQDGTGRKLTSDELDALKTSLNAYALRVARSGLTVPDGLKQMLDKEVLKRVEVIEEENRRVLESPLQQELREDMRKATIEAVEAPVKAIEVAAETTREGLRGIGQVTEEKAFTGVAGNIDRLEETPPFERGTNVFIDDKGKFGDFEIKPLGSAFEFESLASTNNPALQGNVNVVFGKGAERQPSYTEEVQKKVDSIKKFEKELSKVDLSAYKEGMKAFEEGNREGLIRAMTELQSQEAMLRDRWNLLAQTHAQVTSVQNHESAFKNGGGINFFFTAGSGAKRLAEQTAKLNDVRGEILKANNEAFTRRKLLEYALQRMDARVPPETSAPKRVIRIREEKESRNPLFDVKNVVLKAAKMVKEENV